MKVHLKYFASVRESMGCADEVLECSVATVGQVRDLLIARGNPATQALARSNPLRMALDHVLCTEAAAIHEGCELAFFPPVTGG
jgi:molybdopterin synthase sulfur carrier subunit